jgi:putative peptidoglycan lipid II flippase
MTSVRALSNRQIARAAAVVLLGFLTSGALGLVRTAIFSAVFGTSAALDAFYAAQRIPETLFVLVAGGALGSSFIPVFARFLAGEDTRGAWRLASAVMTLTAGAAAVLAVLVAVFAPQLVPALLVPGEPPEVQALTISLTQIMMVTVVIFSISGLVMGILNAHQSFTYPALALSMNNVGLIIGALVFARALPPIDSVGQSGLANVYGLAFGAVLGALLHLAVQLPGLVKVRARLRPSLDFAAEGTREVFMLMGPRVLGLAVVQINFMVNAALSSGMVDGSYTALTTAWTLMFFALGVIAQSVGTAVFPSLAALASAGDMAGFRDRLAGALRGVLFLAFPASIGLIVLGEPLVSVLLERGAWTRESTQATAWALAFFSLGIAGFSLLEILSRAFYALSNTRTPVLVGVGAMVANIALSFLFIRVIGSPDSLSRGAFGGLALANALTTLIEALLLWALLARKIGWGAAQSVADSAGRAAAAAVGMGAVVWGVAAIAAPFGTWAQVFAGGATGVAAFFGLALLLGVSEARTVPALVLRRLRR